jgi:predicted RNA-binding protein
LEQAALAQLISGGTYERHLAHATGNWRNVVKRCATRLHKTVVTASSSCPATPACT